MNYRKFHGDQLRAENIMERGERFVLMWAFLDVLGGLTFELWHPFNMPDLRKRCCLVQKWL